MITMAGRQRLDELETVSHVLAEHADDIQEGALIVSDGDPHGLPKLDDPRRVAAQMRVMARRAQVVSMRCAMIAAHFEAAATAVDSLGAKA